MSKEFEILVLKSLSVMLYLLCRDNPCSFADSLQNDLMERVNKLKNSRDI